MKTVCGLDVHKDSVFCRILRADGRKIQHKFGVLTEELITLRDLMESEGVEECCMESTKNAQYSQGKLLSGAKLTHCCIHTTCRAHRLLVEVLFRGDGILLPNQAVSN